MNSLNEAQKSKGHTVLVVLVASGLTLATLALVAMACSSYRSTLDAGRQNARLFAVSADGHGTSMSKTVWPRRRGFLALTQHLCASRTNSCGKRSVLFNAKEYIHTMSLLTPMGRS